MTLKLTIFHDVDCPNERLNTVKESGTIINDYTAVFESCCALQLGRPLSYLINSQREFLLMD